MPDDPAIVASGTMETTIEKVVYADNKVKLVTPTGPTFSLPVNPRTLISVVPGQTLRITVEVIDE